MSTAVAHRRALYGHNRNAAWQAYLEGELPEGYRRVEYIENPVNIASWIDTGVKVDCNNGFDLEWEPVTFSNNEVFGGGINWGNGLSICTHGSPQEFGFIVGTTEVYRESFVAGRKAIWSVHDKTAYINGIKVGGPSSSVNGSTDKTMTVFRHSGVGVGTTGYKCYRCVLYNAHGDQIRHMVPAVRLTDAVGGLYDICGSICPLTGIPFYINAGSGATFRYEIPKLPVIDIGQLPSEYRVVDYLESTGSQYINTFIRVDSLQQCDLRMVYQKSNGADVDVLGTNNANQPTLIWDVASGSTLYPRWGTAVSIAGSLIYEQGHTASEWNSSFFDTFAELRLEGTASSFKGYIDGELIAVRNDPTAVFRSSDTLYIFGGRNLASIKVRSLSLMNNNIKVRHLIPVVRLSDSKPGMYDLCGSICSLTGTPFYINAGTGADFTYGELQ